MTDNALKQLGALGQSIWLDYIRRDLIASGALRDMIETDGLRGMTSNPAIFEKAIGESQCYDQAIGAMAHEGKKVPEIYETLSQEDVRSAADVFLPVYEKTDGHDGYVSLEVNPHLARDTEGTVLEARRLWAALDRPNVLIKVPGTAADLNQSLERAGRLADYLELAELLCLDALEREESCGGHFREEYQYPDGECKRDDQKFAHVAAWEFQGEGQKPLRNVEPLVYETVQMSVRNYK